METNNFRFYEFGDFKLDVRRRALLKNGIPIQLSGRVFDLLLVMVENEGRILEHEELLDKVWQGTFVEQSNLKKSVSALRRVLEESPNESLYIKTVPRRGYCFVAPVRALADETSGTFYTPETKAKIFGEEGENFDGETLEKESLPPPEAESPIKPDSVSTLPETETFPRKRKSFILALAGVAALLAIAFGVWQFWRGTNRNQTFRLEDLKIQKLTTSGNVQDAGISPDGKTVVYATIGDDNRQTLWAKRLGSSNPLPLVSAGENDYQAIVVSPDNNSVYYSVLIERSQELLYQISIFGGAPRKITEGIVSGVTFSPDGRRVAFARDRQNIGRTLLTASAEDGSDEREIYTVADNHMLIQPVWSPDGKKFTFISSQITGSGRTWAISEIPAAGGEPQNVIAPQRGKIYSFEWLRDGSGLIICADSNDSIQAQLWYAAYPKGEMTRLTNDILTYQSVGLSTDGNAILAVQKEKTGDLWSMNWSLLQNTTRLTNSQNFADSFAVLPDGRILAEYNDNGVRGLWLVNADGGNLQPMFPQSYMERTPGVAPDGKSLLFVSRRSGTQEIWRTDLEGRNPKQLTDEKTFLGNPKLSPDGKNIYFERYDGFRWRFAKMPAEGGQISSLIDETLGEFDFSPDGKMLAYSYFDEQKKKWQTAVRNGADNSLLKQFDISPLTFLRWTTDGKGLIYNVSETSREGGSLWLQSLEGGAPKPILDTKEDKIYWADWSPGGEKLYFTRGRTISNIVLLLKNKQ